MGCSLYNCNCRKRAVVCKDSGCKKCTAPPCGTCYNCLHPEYKNKCIERYRTMFARSMCCGYKFGTRLGISVTDPSPDPDSHVFVPFGSISIRQMYNQAKNEKKIKKRFFYIFVTLFELFIFSRWFKCRYLQKVICRQNRFGLVWSITKILGSGLFFRICPSLNLHKEKKGAGAKKAPSKPPVTCEQCGITVVNKHVLKRHVSTIFRR